MKATLLSCPYQSVDLIIYESFERKIEMEYKKIVLKRGKEESLQRCHPWVFSGAVKYIDEDICEGDVVRVLTSENDFIAVGHYQIGSIAIRVLSFRDIVIDTEFWKQRLLAARRMRESIGLLRPTDDLSAGIYANTTYRLVHGEGDNLPGLVIDCYGETAVIQAHSVGMHYSRLEIAQALADVMGDVIHNIFYKSETTLPFKANLGQENEFLLGGSADNTALENGLRFHVDWLRGQKTGFFIDQRENRMLLEQYSRGRNVLNMFCYTGGFSVYAMRGGASLVHSVDSSAKAIELTDRNVAMNFPGDQRHESFCCDAFKFLEDNNHVYDLIILDPPAFAKHRSALRNALKGYIRLNVKGFESIKPGGILFTFSCSQVVTKDHFRTAVFTAAAQAHRKVRILHQLHQPADHPINIYHPEGEYLKGLVLYVE